MRSSFSYSSRCDRTDTHSPDAIENAPATSPATPASSTIDLLLVPPATPMTSEKFDTSPSFTPKTPARSAPPIPARCRPSDAAMRPPAVFPPRMAATTLPRMVSRPPPALFPPPRGATPLAVHGLLCRHPRRRRRHGAVLVGVGRLGAQHDRE